MRQGDQDGGPNSYGTVIELREWKGEPDRMRFGARVRWDAGGTNTYRWGAEDAWDLLVVGEVDKDTDVRALRDTAPPSRPPLSPLCAADEARALRAVYLATGGPTHWKSKLGWTVFGDAIPRLNATTDPCRLQWDGVVCVNGNIAAL